MKAIHQILQHWFTGFDVFIEGFTFYPVFVAVPGEQCGGCIFHVNIEHAVLAYGMPDPPVHFLDAKLCRPVSTGSILLPVWHKPFSILVQHGKINPQHNKLSWVSLLDFCPSRKLVPSSKWSWCSNI